MSNKNIPAKPNQTDLTVDACSLRCPLPLLKAKQALNRLSVGQCVRVWATDKGSVRDFHAFARLSGHNLLHFQEHEDRYEYVLCKAFQSNASELNEPK